MLDGVSFDMEMDKETYHARLGDLEKQMTLLQLKVKELGIPVILTFDGWGAAGRGTLISKALNPLDPRFFNVYTMDRISEDQYMRPFLWRYFTKIPSAGRFVIFDNSWSMAALPVGNSVRNFDKMDMEGIFYDINAFETQLTANGALIFKFFLHITKEEQARRYKELERNEDTRWRVSASDWRQNWDYDRYYDWFQEIIKKSGGADKWTVIPGNDKRQAAAVFFETITAKLQAAVKKREGKTKQAAKPAKKETVPDILGKVDTDKTITDEDYDKQLKQYQKQLSGLGYKLYRKRRSVVIAYEGWDAAGKGGNIKRLTEELDPRGYDVHPVAAPTADELSRHYLWRFWRDMPKDGHIAVFDRSWYGRVLVERLEGLCKKEEWARAYQEINDMETHLRHHGVIILKFWLHIDKDEQLRRFEARMNDPLKQHKIGEEDWRNRAKWDQYMEATNEMLHKTSTNHAPWVIVESNSKKYARVKVLEHVVNVLEKEV